jgi:hypothetical protein
MVRLWLAARAAIEIGVAAAVVTGAPPAADVTPDGNGLEVSAAPARLVVFEDFTRPT